MIGLAPPGRARSWQIAAALTAVHQAFPSDKVSVSRSTLGSDVLHIVVSSGPIEDSRELLTWRPRGLRIAFPVLAACTDEAAVAKLIQDAVPKIARGAVVEIPQTRRAPTSAGSSAAPGRNAVSTSGASPRSLSLSRSLSR